MPAWINQLRTRFGTLFPNLSSARHQKMRESESKAKKGDPVGKYLDPFETNVILRSIISVIAAVIVTALLYALEWVLGSDILPLWAAIPIALLLALFFALNDSEPLIVPKQYVAIFTFLGMRFNVYFEEGTHYWYGGKVGISWSTDPLPNSDEKKYKSEKSGFVYIGNRPIGVWPSLEQKRQYRLSNVAHDSSTIHNTLTVTFRVVWPLRYANSDDPILDIAERSRSALRTLVSFFVGDDNAMLKSISSKLLEGKYIVTAFLFHPVEGRPAGSVIQDRSGDRILEIVDIPEDEEGEDIGEKLQRRLEEAKQRVMVRINSDANPKMREAVLHENTPVVSYKEVVDHLIPIMTANGAHFEHASVSDVSLSEEVEKQANIAAGENYQRTAQIQNARTIKEAQEILAKGLKTKEGQFATLAALARDGHADIVYVPDSDRLTRAAVAGAKQIGGKK